MKKNILLLCLTISLTLSGCGSKAQKEAMSADLAAYGAFLEALEQVDDGGVAVYAMGVDAAMQEFTCTTEEGKALREDYQKMSDALNELSAGLQAANAAEDNGQLIASFDLKITEIKAQADTDEKALMERAKDLDLLEEYKAAVGITE
ncbi:MAG: hypothetical protein K5773_04240 [Pseudobutyrivibrio sp.]|nr:hypothetical protein [Pseudobutyrivibrio sp.]